MSKECFNIIFRQLKFKKKVRGNYLDGEFELLTLLRYLSTGSFMLISGNLLNISKSTAHKFIHRSIKVICESATAWIKFPADLEQLQQSFERTYRFPGVIGAIDCTHVKIESIGGRNAEVFRNRKGYFVLKALCKRFNCPKSLS